MRNDKEAMEEMRQLVAATGRGFNEAQAKANIEEMGAMAAVEDLKTTIGFVREIKKIDKGPI